MSASPVPRLQFIVEPCPLAHNLINDLTIIVGECDLLDDSFREGVEAERLQIIRAAARRMADRIAFRPCLLKPDMDSPR